MRKDGKLCNFVSNVRVCVCERDRERERECQKGTSRKMSEIDKNGQNERPSATKSFWFLHSWSHRREMVNGKRQNWNRTLVIISYFSPFVVFELLLSPFEASSLISFLSGSHEEIAFTARNRGDRDLSRILRRVCLLAGNLWILEIRAKGARIME